MQFLENELLLNSSIVALQEFWLRDEYASIFEKGFKKLGFDTFTLRRTGQKTDAVAFMIKSSDFEMIQRKDISLCRLGDRVALLLWLRHKKSGKNVLVANTHLTFPHNMFDRSNQLRQMRILLDSIENFVEENEVGPATRVVTGDFNVEGHSPVCEHLRQAGYQSCFEIVPPTQQEEVCGL